jgi:hypothetical protein
MRRILGLMTLAALAAACSETTAPSGDQLTLEEAQAVAQEIVRSGEKVYAESAVETLPGASTAANEPLTIRIDHDSTHPCPVGGNVALALTVNLELDGVAQSLVYEVDGALTHAACAFIEEGVTLTVDGDPNLEFHANIEAAAGQAGPYTATADGALDWTASDGRSGRCVIDISSVTDFVARSRTVSGEVCGHTFQQTMSWSDASG